MKVGLKKMKENQCHLRKQYMTSHKEPVPLMHERYSMSSEEKQTKLDLREDKNWDNCPYDIIFTLGWFLGQSFKMSASKFWLLNGFL